MSELPKGWENTKLERLLGFVIGGDWGKDPDIIDDDLMDVLCIRGTEFRHWPKEKGRTAVPRKVKASSLNKRKLELGDILVEISGGGPEQPVGRTVIIDEQAIVNAKNIPLVCTNFTRLARPIKNIDPAYLNFYLTKFYSSGEITKYQSGSNNLRNLQFKDYLQIDIPLAPLAEQKRIVAKLDEVLAQVDAIKARLDRIPAILKRFRQSVLAAAVSGKLITVTEPIKVKIGDVISDIRYGTSKKCDYQGGQTPVIRIPNISDRKLDISDLKSADFTENELKTLALKAGDILVIRSNGSLDLVAKPALVGHQYEGFLYAGYLIRLRCDKKMIIPDFLLNILSSRVVRNVVELGARSTSGVNNINSKELASLEFLLPSIEEQTEIVRLVDHYFIFADTIEAQVKKAQARVDNLTQSILAKAFRGELVPQDPNDEPADKLLERIAKARIEADALAKTSKKAVRAKKYK